jgi:hypothetical protein
LDRTRIYREQHREIIRLAGELTAALDPTWLAGDPTAVHALMMHFGERLNAHLDLEDGDLYPLLLQHADAAVRDLAGAYQAEMGRIHGDFEALLARWHSVASVQADPFGFAVELLSALDVLHRRIHQEDGELYPLVDALG